MEHSASVLKSALQKFIRRGMHGEALAVAHELCSLCLATRTSDGGKDVVLWEVFWRRLHVIATEDIGVAQYGTHDFLNRLNKEASKLFHSTMLDNDCASSTRTTTNKKKEGSIYAHCQWAVWTLSHSPKSRLTDNAYVYFSRQTLPRVGFEHLYKHVETRDERSLLQLVTSAYRSRNTELREEDVYQAIRANLDDHRLLRNEVDSLWAEHQARPCGLYLMHMALLLCRGLPAKRVVTTRDELTTLNLDDETTNLLAHELPDFVYDMHTTRGRERLGRGFSHFVQVSCILVDCHIEDPYYELLLRETASQ